MMATHATIFARTSQFLSRRFVTGGEGSAEILRGSAIIGGSAEGVRGKSRSPSIVVSIFCSWTIILRARYERNSSYPENPESVF